MSGSKSESPESKIIAGFRRILEELEHRIEDAEYQIRNAGLSDVLESVNEFREIMNDLRALVEKDTDYFNIRVSVWRSRDGVKASAQVLGHALEFNVDGVDPNTPIAKIIDAVLSNEENLIYAASRAFAALSDFAYKIESIANIREKIENIEKELHTLKRVLTTIESMCKEG